jgi:hypothetical protein
MYRYGAQFVDHSNADCTEMICKAKYFASLMNDLKYQERQIRSVQQQLIYKFYALLYLFQ